MPAKLPHGRPSGRPRSKRPAWQHARAQEQARLRAYRDHPERARIDALLAGHDPDEQVSE